MNIIFHILIICIVLFILNIQYKYINQVHNSTYEINQINNPDKTTFENIIESKNPVVFINILKNLDLSTFDLDNLKKKEQLELKIDLTEHFKYYLIPLCIKYNFMLNKNNKKSYTPIIKQTNYRYLLAQIKGVKKILLFNPKQEKFLYPNKSRTESRVNFWEMEQRKKFPLFKKSKYIELIVQNNQMVFIPYKWWYTIYDVSDNISISSVSESVFSYFLKNKK